MRPLVAPRRDSLAALTPAQRPSLLARPRRAAIVLIASSSAGLDIFPAIIEAVMAGRHPSLSWLGVSRKCHRPCTVIVEGRRHGGGEVK